MENIRVAGKEYELASRGNRWWGQFLDDIITLFVAGIIGWLVAYLLGHEDIEESYVGLSVAISLLIFGWIFKDGVKNGQSLAKKLLSTRVISSKDGSPCGYRKSFLRNLLVFLPLINLIDTGCIFGAKRQRLGDKLAGTLVVKCKPRAETEFDPRDDKRSHKTATVLLILLSLGYAFAYFTGEETIRATDGQSEVTVPWTWERLNMNKNATLQVGSMEKELYLAVFPIDKQGREPTNLETLSEAVVQGLASRIKLADISDPKNMEIDGIAAIQYKVSGEVDGLSTAFLYTYVEDGFNYYQISAWTFKPDFEKSEPKLQKVIQSFRLINP